MADLPKKVLIVTLENTSMFNETNSAFLTALSSKATVIVATTKGAVSQHLSSGSLAAIFIADPVIMRASHKGLAISLVAYVKQGGSLVLGGLFPSFAPPPKINKFFESVWELPWESGTYLRTTFAANPNMRIDITSSIAQSYSMKALHLKNVATEDLVYVTTKNSSLESLVFYPERVELQGEGPVVFAQYHGGRLGWIGDVNSEDETAAVAIAMMGL